ncbi:hypothetical protein N7520_008971 [Penicillium odoratum]|uniref:uncharacterized protein n=1 Tax=Penicillium odoratum TaxID=1167516 RepID=UPI0025479453|nr:uncharacterized protein N7520_008971 [Penicillium odoratum]KAJ5752054.1 hypothetical protein N7520_008971 [Penicillium odoratum]
MSKTKDTTAILGLIEELPLTGQFSLHLKSEYSDMTIICGDKTFPAHKLVVCPRSKYFHRACFGGFREAESPIHLDDQDPIIIEKMLEYLYKGDYTCQIASASGSSVNSDSVSGHGSSYFHALMYAAADYLMIEDLKRKSMEYFSSKFMPSTSLNLAGSSVVSLPRIKKEFAETIEEIYSTRADYQELRKLAIEKIKDDLFLLRKGNKPIINSELMKSNPDFTYDLCEATLTKYVA